MKKIFILILLGSLNYNLAAQDTTLFSADPGDSLQNTPLFQMSPAKTIPDSLIIHRDPSWRLRFSETFGESSGRKYLIGTTIVANWAAFYLKRRADKHYQNYLRASNKNQLQKYYQSAREYDNYATVAIIISATALSAYLWFLFND